MTNEEQERNWSENWQTGIIRKLLRRVLNFPHVMEAGNILFLYEGKGGPQKSGELRTTHSGICYINVILVFLYSSWGSHGTYTGVVCHSLLQWKRGCQRMRWLDDIINAIDMNLGKLQDMLQSMGSQSQTFLGDRTTTIWCQEKDGLDRCHSCIVFWLASCEYLTE